MLIKNGHEVHIACSIVRPVNLDKELSNCLVHDIPFQRVPFNKKNFIAYKLLKRLIIQEKYDLVHTHTPVASIMVRLVCRKMNSIKVFYTAHGFHFFKGGPIIYWIIYFSLEKYLSRFLSLLITINSEDYNNSLKYKFKAKKIVKIEGVGIDLSKFTQQNIFLKEEYRNKFQFSSDDFILIYVAELSNRKNQEIAILAINKLKVSIPNIKLILVGDGIKKNYYRKLINKFKLEPNVKLLGYRKDVPALMQMSDLALSTSKQEGLPVNLLEGMATGLPLIVSNSRGNIDLVTDGFNGCVFEKNDFKSLSLKIYELYNNPEKMLEFSSRNLNLIKKYSIEKILKDLSNLYVESGIINDKIK